MRASLLESFLYLSSISIVFKRFARVMVGRLEVFFPSIVLAARDSKLSSGVSDLCPEIGLIHDLIHRLQHRLNTQRLAYGLLHPHIWGEATELIDTLVLTCEL